MFREIWLILKKPGVNSPGSISIFFFFSFEIISEGQISPLCEMRCGMVWFVLFFLHSAMQIWAEKWLVVGLACGWRQCGFAGQCVRHQPLLVHWDFSNRGHSLRQPARDGSSAVLAMLLGLKWQEPTFQVYQQLGLPAGSSLICRSSNIWIE